MQDSSQPAHALQKYHILKKLESMATGKCNTGKAVGTGGLFSGFKAWIPTF